MQAGFPRALARKLAFAGILACAAACTTARPLVPSAPVLQADKPEPLPPEIKPLTVEQAEQVGR
ncbi:hypothetical protein [Phyllobacterium calauticae]|jgi:hypothetical protein|uniref:hypothetical protein n=1 Tax=Phyllobacterium calauticae TaxID=2817027 RepID=UPI001CBD6A8E|nr:hypothetical protein [Phyllobacterium calauticae]MBZ3692085.1 hypothetical protein [Phyllobacterium calauticae]